MTDRFSEWLESNLYLLSQHPEGSYEEDLRTAFNAGAHRASVLRSALSQIIASEERAMLSGVGHNSYNYAEACRAVGQEPRTLLRDVNGLRLSEWKESS